MPRPTPTRAVSPRATATATIGFAPAPAYALPEVINPDVTRIRGNGVEPVERLPPEAQAKFYRLKQAADDALALSRIASDQRSAAIQERTDAAGRLQRHEAALARTVGMAKREDGSPDFTTDPEWSRLKAELDRVAERYERIAALSDTRGELFQAKKATADNLARWLERQSPEASFQPVATKPITPTKSENIAVIIERVRSDIATKRDEVERLKSAPPSKAEAIAAAEAYIASMVAEGAPDLRQIAAPARDARVVWPSRLAETTGFIASQNGGVTRDPNPPRVRSVDPIAVAAWLTPDVLRARLLDEVAKQFGDGLDATAKAARLAELAGEIEQLERTEESTIALAEDGGVEVLRRPDANPLAVLALTIT